jgi:predicted Zn-dependent protease
VPEAEATLWTIARQFPDQTWVDQTLYDAYRSRQDTANMRDVMNLLRNNDPSIPRYQHDWALLSLLSNPTTSWDQPKRVLERLYHEKPANPFYATSFAFALAQTGKAKEALAVIGQLSQLDRDFSPRQPYLAYIYGLNRNRDEVERAQSKGSGTAYLPEEAALFLKAREALERRALPPAKPVAGKPAAS